VPSRPTQFSVAFTTNIAESNFRYTQVPSKAQINSRKPSVADFINVIDPTATFANDKAPGESPELFVFLTFTWRGCPIAFRVGLCQGFTVDGVPRVVRLPSKTARILVRNMPSKVPAPPIDATGAPRLAILSRFMRSAPINVPSDPAI